MRTIKLKEETYGKRKFITFRLSREDFFMEKHLSRNENIRWSDKRKCWYMERSRSDINQLFNYLRKTGYFLDYSTIVKKTAKEEDQEQKYVPANYGKSSNNRNLQKNAASQLPELTPAKKKQIKQFSEWMQQKRYRRNTINIYTSILSVFFRFHAGKETENIGISDIENFNCRYILRNKYSGNFQNQAISAVKLFYTKMLGINFEFENLERPRRGKPLPKVIDKENIKKLLTSIKNEKHKTALSVIYGLGLRRSELINLKLTDIDLRREIISIKDSKGAKDRSLPLPQNLKQLIIRYYNKYQPLTYLIEGAKPGETYSETSLQNIFKKNLGRIIKNHNFTLHDLRHSYATHMHESGVDIRYIQELLGHKSSKTTEVYTHVSIRSLKNLNNPTDGIEF